jgi:hypothetical protein
VCKRARPAYTGTRVSVLGVASRPLVFHSEGQPGTVPVSAGAVLLLSLWVGVPARCSRPRAATLRCAAALSSCLSGGSSEAWLQRSDGTHCWG